MSLPFQLDRFQQESIDLARAGNSVIVSAPTGAGKTLIAEQIIEDCMSSGKGVIYTAPIKALSNQKFRDFSHKYPDQVGIVTGDVTINRNAPILIMTTEIFRNAIMTESKEFGMREWVIFDEIHYLDDIERGTVWEESIILLPRHMKILALSATIPNINELVDWLTHVHAFPVKVVLEATRPVPLRFMFQCNNEFFPDLKSLETSRLLHLRLPLKKELFKHASPTGKQACLPARQEIKPNRLFALLERLKEMRGYPCVYFSFSRRRCQELADEAAHFDLLDAQEKEKISALFAELLAKFNLTSGHIAYLEPLIKRGIAYHHAGLLPTLKEIIERLFTSGLIKLIFTTETFALGINMPARTVAFDTLSKFYGRQHHYLRTRDFYQMAGRAGRRGKDDEGFVISRITSHQVDMENLQRIIYGGYEPIRSQFNSCYATILNLYSLMGEKILDIYPRSFHCHQSESRDQADSVGLLRRKLGLLKQMEYIQGGRISPKGELAAQMYSFELAMGELFAASYFDEINEEDLFIIITALVYEPRRNEDRPRLNKHVRRLWHQMSEFTQKIRHMETHFHIHPVSKDFFFHLNEPCKLWFEGASFERICRASVIDEGEIVRYLRMSTQVCKEMLACELVGGALKEKLSRCLSKVNRDVVDAEKQLRQEL